MKIRRRTLLLAATAWPFAVIAQQAKRLHRIGFLSGAPGIGEPEEAFRQRLRELGHVEGKNLVIEWRFLQGRPELESMFSGLRDNRPEVLSVVGIGWINTHRSRVLDVIAKLELPAIFSNDAFVPIGGLISYAADSAHQYGEAAACVAKILAGAKSADLPVQQPTKFELAINPKTAKALGITFPQTILVRADRVIE